MKMLWGPEGTMEVPLVGLAPHRTARLARLSLFSLINQRGTLEPPLSVIQTPTLPLLTRTMTKYVFLYMEKLARTRETSFM